jgi:tetratricopeptide (TPR) repeat protein
MATPFLGSEEYDEHAHRLYDNGEYERALEVLKDGLVLYPDSVELLIGLGYTRLVREEFVWAKHAFEKALALEPAHEDALAGLGEVLLRFGRHEEALRLFQQVRHEAGSSDLDLLLAMGRALYREHLFHDALEIFDEAIAWNPESADAHAARAYTVHRPAYAGRARRELRHALTLDPRQYEARVYLGHLLYDRGDWLDALEQFELVPPAEQWDTLAICRLVELKRTLHGCRADHPDLRVWDTRLGELVAVSDPIDELLAEVERQAATEPPTP